MLQTISRSRGRYNNRAIHLVYFPKTLRKMHPFRFSVTDMLLLYYKRTWPLRTRKKYICKAFEAALLFFSTPVYLLFYFFFLERVGEQIKHY